MSLSSILEKVVAVITGKPTETDRTDETPIDPTDETPIDPTDETPIDQTDETPIEHPAEQVHNAEFYQEQETH